MDIRWKKFSKHIENSPLCFCILNLSTILVICCISYLQIELLGPLILGILYLSSLSIVFYGIVMIYNIAGKEKRVILLFEPMRGIKTEILYLVGIFSFIGSIFFITAGEQWVRSKLHLTLFQYAIATEIIVFLFTTPFVFLFYVCVYLFLRKMITGTHYKDSSIVSLFNRIILLFKEFQVETRCMRSALVGNFIQYFVCLCLMIFILFLNWYEEDKVIGIFVLFIICGVMNAYFIIRSSNYKELAVLLEQIKRISGGEILSEPLLDEGEILYEASLSLSQISIGMGKSIEKQVKSEKMKVDLITNVSHDLKTPLTSIIGYIDLLKKEELTEVTRDYVDAMSIKSNKLKEMVQNLFELSKVTSGNAEMMTEQLDLKKLLEQTMADMSDQIERSGKSIRWNAKPTELFIMADGKMLYRVYQNLIENALKYSMEQTRIFLQIEEENGYGVVAIKNIASYEMNFNKEAIVERFQRGDESRTTEGNGLGLAIAKSFTENCNGIFEVILDGDLFKVITKFPMLTDEEVNIREKSTDNIIKGG